MTDAEKQCLINRCIILQNKYYSHILNLDAKSKQWQLSARALTRLSRTLSYSMMIEQENKL